MWLERVSLRNVRCFKRYDIDLNPRLTLITGRNGSGKSTILEAVHVLGTARSFRTGTVRDLIPWNEVAFSIRGTVSCAQSQDHIHIAYSGHEKSVTINDIPQTSRRELSRILPVVSVSEEDMQLIQGYPESRRLFLDHSATMLDPAHRERLLMYHHVARQRTALILQRVARNNEDLKIWTEKLYDLSTSIRRARRHALQRIEEEITILHEAGGVPAIQCTYNHEEEVTAESWIAQHYDAEMRMKRNLAGAHRDDCIITIAASGTTARRFESRGMQKLLVLALKIAHVRLSNGGILLLDDIISDFDDERFSIVVQLLNYVQAQKIITSPLLSDTRGEQLVKMCEGKSVPL